MKRLLYPILLICISVLTFNCQKEVSSGGGNPVTPIPSASPITASLQGTVFDETGQPASGVSIKVGSKTATTNAKGYFRINNASLDKYASLVTAEKAGYFKALRTFNATSGANLVMIKLIKRTSAGNINAASGGNVSLTNGAKISLPANAVINAQTNAVYSGSVTVYAAYIDPTSADIGREVPGSFSAIDANNRSVILTSYGMMAVELASASGEKLQIAAGKTATLTTPIPASAVASAPTTISLWYLDEQTGLWKEEGQATKNGSAYVGDVKHFTYWNCDYPGPKVNFTATFHNGNGIPITNSYVVVRPVSGTSNGYAHGFTDSLGQVSGPIPANINLVLEVRGYCNAIIYSQNIGPYTSDVNLGTVTIPNNTTGLITVTGKLLNCSGAPVTNGYAVIYYNYSVRNCPTDNNGNFSTIFLDCVGSPTTCEITGVDLTSQQQSIAMNYPISAPTLNVGTITACGISTMQYINCTIDGISNNFLSGADSLYAYTYSINPNPFSLYTGAQAFRPSTTENIYFTFEHDNTVGAYPLMYIQTWLYQRMVEESPISVNISNAATAPGAYYEGNFAGQFRDTSNLSLLHTINCSFRVRRN